MCVNVAETSAQYACDIFQVAYAIYLQSLKSVRSFQLVGTGTHVQIPESKTLTLFLKDLQ